MNREEFTRLSLPQALGVLFDAFPSLALMEPPPVPLPARMPRFDQRLSTRGGYCWASECDMSQLQYYLSRASKPSTDPKWETKNEKDRKALGYFLAWREQNPMALWSGERYQQGIVTAAPPTARPRVTEWEPRPESAEPVRSNYPSDGDEDDFLFGGAGK